jgi:hypothetical protein
LISLVGNHNNTSLQAIKKRIKWIQKRLISRNIEYYEPPFGVENPILGVAIIAGSAQTKIWRWMQELGWL